METVVSRAAVAARRVPLFSKKTSDLNFLLDGIFREKQSPRIDASIAILLAPYFLLAGLPPFSGLFALLSFPFVSGQALGEPKNTHGMLNQSLG